MAKNVIVINVDLRETRVSLIEDGVIAELHIERAAHRGTVGNVVLGKVSRVLPGMQAAFIDVGQDRAAFLHVEDLIRPADFDAYLASDLKNDKTGVAPKSGEVQAAETSDQQETEPARDGSGKRRRRRGRRRGRGSNSGGEDAGTVAPLDVQGETAKDDASPEGNETADAAEALSSAVDDEVSDAVGDLQSTAAALEEDSSDPSAEQEAVDRTQVEQDDDETLAAYHLTERERGEDEEYDFGEHGTRGRRLGRASQQSASSDDEELSGTDFGLDDDDSTTDDEELSGTDFGLDDDNATAEERLSGEGLDEDVDEDSAAVAADGLTELTIDHKDDPSINLKSISKQDTEQNEVHLQEDSENSDRTTDDTEDATQVSVPASRSRVGSRTRRRVRRPRTSEAAVDTEAAVDAEAAENDDAKEDAPRRRRSRPNRGNGDRESLKATDDNAGTEDAQDSNPTEGSTARRSRRRRGRRRRGAEEPSELKDERKSEELDAETATADNERGGRKRRRRRGRRGEPRETESTTRAAKSVKAGKLPSRVSRSVPITEVVKEGDHVVVQISKEPIGTKGARVTSHVSLPGRYVVYLPTVEHVGISKRIGNARERSRLRQSIETLKPQRGGLIVRTVAEGLTKKQLKADVGYLIKVWSEIAKQRAGAKAPSILYEELDLVLKVARDFFTDEIDHIIIDDKDQYGRLVRFVEMFMPTRGKDVKLYEGDEPVFDAFGIEDEIKRALGRKVPLPNGGSLIVDQAEALTAVDVNTGRYVGKGSAGLEETALKTNLEAVDEIAYQLRFRNIGGLVILDLIDMESSSNREKVWRALEQKLAKDKAKTTINRISDLGLIEMTRKRTRESLGRIMHEPCFYCDGTGHIQSRETISYEILRQIRRERQNLPGYSIRVQAHPAVIDFLKFEARDATEEAERRYMRRLELVPRQEYHIEQYDLQGK